MRKEKRSRRSRRLRGISTTKRWRTRKGGGDKKCLFINWGPGIGLGNQLFIYAAALIVKNKLKNWDICIPPVEKNPHTSTDYRFLFKQGQPIELTPEMKERVSNAAAVVHKNKNVRHGSWKNQDLIVNSGDEFKNSTKNLRMKTTNDPEGGYYQNYGSIEPAIATIRPEIQDELTKKYGSDPLIAEPDSSAFIHIRYGDYKEYKLTSSIEYFKAGKARLEEESAIKTIYIISDKAGIEWLTKEGGTAPGKKAIHTIDDPDELKVLYYMSQCKAGACISASTYSIWGAIMGPGTNDSSVIIYPSKWNGMVSGRHIEFPERWIML